ncbi:hypothetical protein protein [Bacillus cereus G9241]|nr:hypothetical protein protein [Bacillus cereus G9241]
MGTCNGKYDGKSNKIKKLPNSAVFLLHNEEIEYRS